MKIYWCLALLCVGTASATFQKLSETCRTASGLGVCVQSDVCCTAVGGTVGAEINSTSSEPTSGRSSYYFNKKFNQRNGRRLSPLSARAAELTAFPEGLQERTAAGASFGCSYNGLCCVLPTPTDYDCSSCGLWGDGVRQKVTTPPPVTTPPTSTTNTPPLKKITPRIVNGDNAPRGRWCWQVAILDANGLVCGGALIARNWVLTAAHCVAGRFLDELIVALGLYDFVHSDPTAIVYYHTPIGAFLNPSYNPANWNGDLALIRIPDAPCGEPGVCTVCLGPPVTFVPVTTEPPATTTIAPTTVVPTTTYTYGASFFNPLQATFNPKATLNKIAAQIASSGGGTVDQSGNIVPSQDNPYANLVCAITGWGSTGISPVAPVLQEAWQQIISPQQCEQSFADLGVPEEKINLPEFSFCSNGLTLTESSCVGDGGSPLVCQSHADHSWSLYGIIILGSNMCMPGAVNGPTISITVGNYIDWILQTVHELPVTDTNGGRNAYKIPGCGINNFVPDDPVRGGCPVNLHAQLAALQGAGARSLLVTGGHQF